jgi:hypothetical protein
MAGEKKITPMQESFNTDKDTCWDKKITHTLEKLLPGESGDYYFLLGRAETAAISTG